MFFVPGEVLPLGVRGLVVEDERGVGELVQWILRDRFGWESIHVSSVEEAIKRLEKESFGIIVSDLRLPDVTGLVLWEWLQEHRPELADHTLIVTGDAGSPQLAAALNRAKVAVLQKPFAVKEFVGAVERVWSRAQPSSGKSF